MFEKIKDVIELAIEIAMFALCFAAFFMISFVPFIFPEAFGG